MGNASYPPWVPRNLRWPGPHDDDDDLHPDNYADPEAELQREVREREIDEELDTDA